jgi:hypothetical protein
LTSIIHRRNDCRACESKDLELVLPLKPTPIGDAFVTKEKLNIPQQSYPLDLYICKACGLAQIIDVIDPKILYGDYIYQTSSSLGLESHFNSYADTVISKCNLMDRSLIVDIGSNDGTLLEKFKDRGMTVLGIEPASHIASLASSRGIHTVENFFTPDLARELVNNHGHAKVITANNVFANIDDLMTMVTAIDRLLAKDGVFILESSYLADLVKNTVFDFIYHEHLSSFSVRPIQALFKRVGMEVAGLQRVPTKGGSLRYFIQRLGEGPLHEDGIVKEFLSLEEGMGLYTKKTYDDFSNKIDSLKREVRTFLSKAKEEKKTIAGFGASITGTTLIYHFEIGEFLDFMVDDNVAKQGRYSPGLHLPVLPTAVLAERRPDYVIALAWRYAEPFINKHISYLESGGSVIVPVPEFRVVSK